MNKPPMVDELAEIEWRSGSPPHAGWWLCREEKSITPTWRWWNGQTWSFWVLPTESSFFVSDMAKRPSFIEGIRWCYYWPENARVPRIDPDTWEITGGVK
jgi:hypothetical protein